MELSIGVVGATGMVGETFLSLLESEKLSVRELRPFASEHSLGQKLECKGRAWPVQTLKEGCFDGLNLVFFSSGDEISKEWAPKAQAAGAFAIDNSAAFRMSEEHLLCVPEINADQLPNISDPQIIANPNCSTIQLVVALAPLAQQFGLESVHVATYQAVSGAGKAGRSELENQIQAYARDTEHSTPEAFAHPIAFNCLPHIGSFNEQGFCSEEMKIMRETKKILGLPQLRVSAFAVRVPVWNGHSEAVWVRLKEPGSLAEVKASLKEAPGLVFVDQNQESDYPLVSEVCGKKPVYLGRLHQDIDDPQTFVFWVVADNLLKGAAWNGLQIAKALYS